VKFEAKDQSTGENEWMWLLVNDSDDGRIMFGRLDSEPFVNVEMRLGMEPAVSYDNVRDHRTAASFKH